MAAATYLGTLCKRGHDHEGSGRSLRRSSNRSCVVCNYWCDLEKARARKQKWRQANREKLRVKSKEWRQAYPEKARAKNEKWRQANLEKSRAHNRKMWRKEAVAKVPQKLQEIRATLYDLNSELKQAYRKAKQR